MRRDVGVLQVVGAVSGGQSHLALGRGMAMP